LINQLRAREVKPRLLVDISRIGELAYVRIDGGALAVGATTRLAALVSDGLVRERCPGLADAAASIGDPQVRGQATAAGNLGNVGASDLAPVLLASGGEVVVADGDGTESVPAPEFFARASSERLAAPTLVVELRFGRLGAGSRYEKLSRRVADPALVGAAAFVAGGDNGEGSGLALIGVHADVIEVGADQWADEGGASGPDLDRVRAAVVDACEGLEPPDDAHASAAYRREVAPVVAIRAVTAAVRRRQEGGG
jgi:carbon-monoxide dehydrogenase medium subunit